VLRYGSLEGQAGDHWLCGGDSPAAAAALVLAIVLWLRQKAFPQQAALANATVVALVTAAVLIRDLLLLGVGAVGVLITVPVIFDRYFEGELAAPLALLGAGVLLIGLGVITARRRGRQAVASPLPTPTRIPPWQAVACATAVVALVTPVVVLLGQDGR